MNLYSTFGFKNFDDETFDYLNFFEKTLKNYQEYDEKSIQFYEILFEFMSLYFAYKPENQQKTFESMINYFKQDIKIVQIFVDFMIFPALKSETFEEIFIKFIDQALLEEISNEDFLEIFSLWNSCGELIGMKILLISDDFLIRFFRKYFECSPKQITSFYSKIHF